MASLADNLEPPYYAAIIDTEPHTDAAEPASAADRLVTNALRRPGFLGLETATRPDGRAVTVAYWRGLDDVEGWKAEDLRGEEPLPLEVCRVASAADAAARTLYVVRDDSRSTWLYT